MDQHGIHGHNEYYDGARLRRCRQYKQSQSRLALSAPWDRGQILPLLQFHVASPSPKLREVTAVLVIRTLGLGVAVRDARGSIEGESAGVGRVSA
jgi:hypothetical protein